MSRRRSATTGYPRKDTPPRPAIRTFREALLAAGPRPSGDSSQHVKKNYAQNLSNRIAVLVANHLREIDPFDDILPDRSESGVESVSAGGSNKRKKRTDVRYATAATGLELLVSIKTLNFVDPRTGRFTKNMVRNDHELRAEAMDHHERFPYSVLVALFFLPIEACDDGVSGNSSFAHAILTFRPRAGRIEPSDPPSKFERLFVGLYSSEVEADRDIGFFDVMSKPPRRGRPPWPSEHAAHDGGQLLTLEEVIEEIVKAFRVRNRTYIEWADDPSGVLEPVDTLIEDESEDSDDDSG